MHTCYVHMPSQSHLGEKKLGFAEFLYKFAVRHFVKKFINWMLVLFQMYFYTSVPVKGNMTPFANH